jgi:hypothetical protein
MAMLNYKKANVLVQLQYLVEGLWTQAALKIMVMDGYSKLAQKSLQGENTVYDRLTIVDAHNQIQTY